MHAFDFADDRPGLLVSVRNAEEARIAIAGGADVIDVKEPLRGSLGAADAEMVSAVVAAVHGRLPVSVAAGELFDGGKWCDAIPVVLDGVLFVKCGLAGCGLHVDWAVHWRKLMLQCPKHVQSVAVVYADWRVAVAPPPLNVLRHARELSCSALLIDTWDKSRGTLFDHWHVAEVRQFCARARAAGLAVVLAGSLSHNDVSAAMVCLPHLLAVRGAVCVGGRSGQISLSRIRTLRAAIDSSSRDRRFTSVTSELAP